MQRLPIDWIGDTRKSGREINETKAGVNLLVLRKKSILLQVGQFHIRTDVVVVNGVDVDQTFGLL